jgi:hypothetical protein
MTEDPDEILGIGTQTSTAAGSGYCCPRCGGVLQRGSSFMAGVQGGLVGGLLYSAFSSLQCQKCGKIPSRELPKDARHEFWVGSLFMALGAILILIVVLLFVASTSRGR